MFLLMVGYVAKLRQGLNLDTIQTSKSFLMIFEMYFSCMYKLTFFINLWKSKLVTGQILNSFSTEKYETSLGKVEQLIYSIPFLLFGYGIIMSSVVSRMIQIPLTGIVRLEGVTNMAVTSLSSWYQALKIESNLILDLRHGLSFYPPVETNNDDDSIAVVCLYLMMGLLLLSKCFVAYFSELGLLMHILTLMVSVKAFVARFDKDKILDGSKQVATSKKQHWVLEEVRRDEVNLVLKQYESLRHLSSMVNSFHGTILIYYFGETILTHGIHLTLNMYSGSITLQVMMLLFEMLSILVFVCSAEIPRQVSWYTVGQLEITLYL